jgi:hypothetical protein
VGTARVELGAVAMVPGIPFDISGTEEPVGATGVAGVIVAGAGSRVSLPSLNLVTRSPDVVVKALVRFLGVGSMMYIILNSVYFQFMWSTQSGCRYVWCTLCLRLIIHLLKTTV